MKAKFFTGLLLMLATASFGVNAQVTKPKTTPPKSETTKEKTSPNSVPNTNQSSNQIRQTTYVRPNSKERFNRYLKSTVGPVALAKNVASAGFSTWRNSPEEWGKQWEGFGRRFASNLGRSAIRNTTSYALEETFKLDSRFYRSPNRKVGARLKNALISPVTARDANGKRVFGFPRIAGTYAAGIISYETWYPSRYNYKDGLRSGTISFGRAALVNLVREFILK
jgi:hypothetical protein